jgi:hypothetical protein
MIEAQRKLGITDITRGNKRRLQSLIESGGIIDTDAPKKPKLDKADAIQKELMEDLLAYIRDHPSTKVLESALEPGDVTLEDLEKVIKKDKLNVVTGDDAGLKNFETLIQVFFDTLETRLTDLHNKVILPAVTEAKKTYLKTVDSDLCTTFSTKLTVTERDALLARPAFASTLMTVDPVTNEKQLTLNVDNVDSVIELQRAVAEELALKK